MTQLTFQPAFDAFHALFRLLRLRPVIQELDPLPTDHIRILDFYLLFPFRISSIRLTRKDQIYKRLAARYVETKPYGKQPEAAAIFRRMEPIQVAAFGTLAANSLIDADAFRNGIVKITDLNVPPNISDRINIINNRQDDLMKFLKVIASDYYIFGTDGLKDRTGLLEYRYDSI